MALTLEQHLKNTATLTFSYMGDEIRVVYYPNILSRKTLAQLQDGIDPFTDTLPKLIQSWNIYEDAAETIMLPVERGEELGFPFGLALFKAISGEFSPEAPGVAQKTTSSFS